jgi:hypothetical protein
MKCRTKYIFPLILVGIAAVLSSCVTQKQHRENVLWEIPQDHSYSLAFLEFTERGNLYNRDRLKKLLTKIEAETDVLVLVFVHGWKHNASESDENVRSFQRLLKNLAKVDALGKQKVIGVYIGWPGLTINAPLLQESTFWARKAVAEEVGRGGVTEVLLKLEKSVSKSSTNQDKLLIVIGHSFGGAIVLSALNEVLMDKIIYAEKNYFCYNSTWPEDTCDPSLPCVRTDTFGHGVVLLNPAIEANEILQLKELVSENCYPRDQDKLLHVISTDADAPTHKYFPLGQKLKMLTKHEEKNLDRVYRSEKMSLSEADLGSTTIGNFDKFWTGKLVYQDELFKYCSFALDNWKNCSDVPPPEDSIPTRTYEPISFIYTDKNFMSGHNDVFNDKVAAYVGAIALESLHRSRQGNNASSKNEEGDSNISLQGDEFNFGRSFLYLQKQFSKAFREQEG